MRLWHYKLIPVLPDKMLIAQWRECIAIKRQWEKGTLKHRLVSYVMDYDKDRFSTYVTSLVNELKKRNIRYKDKYLEEIYEFCKRNNTYIYYVLNNEYPEHNDRYLRQCFYNLQEKFDHKIISEEEWNKIDILYRYGATLDKVKLLNGVSCEYCGGKIYDFPFAFICKDCGQEAEFK